MSENPKDDGGAAFPLPTSAFDDGRRGMSLRDWFAGMAIKAAYDNIAIGADWDVLAKDAYEMADAMLKKRKERTA